MRLSGPPMLTKKWEGRGGRAELKMMRRPVHHRGIRSRGLGFMEHSETLNFSDLSRVQTSNFSLTSFLCQLSVRLYGQQVFFDKFSLDGRVCAGLYGFLFGII